MYGITRLDNGIRVVTYNMPRASSAAIGVWVAVGSRYENSLVSGISHFIEHLLFKGTKKRSAGEIKKSIEGKGGSLNGFTGDEFTCYLCKVLAKDLRLGLDVLADMVSDPLLKANDIERERRVICEEIKMYFDLPNYHVNELLNELLWPGQPLGRLISGTVETVSRIKRPDIKRYMERFYIPRNIIVSVCGAITHGDVLKWCRKYLVKKSEEKRIPFQKAKILQAKPRFNFYHQQTKQIHIALGFHSFSRLHPERYALDLLNVVLGANMSSRLFEQVREKRGLAYAIRSEAQKHQDTGAFVINMGVENGKSARALDVVLRELDKTCRTEVSKEELNRAKEFLKGQLLLGLEDSVNYMLWIGEKLLTLKRVPDINEILKKIDSVSSQDLKNVAKKIFTSRHLSLALIGTLTEKEKAAIERRV